jgi:nucleoside-diphosphate-sugar epimerase
MNILVTGASGFIASHIVNELLASKHQVRCCVRDVQYTRNIFPHAEVISANFEKDLTSQIWFDRLDGIDVVINCVGILHHMNKNVVWRIHYDAPKALFDACVQKNIKKIIQISALGVTEAHVDYATSKKAADDYLLTLPIPSFILRPSIVYGQGSYGGTSLFRGMAALPFIIPIPGKGEQSFQPIHINDLSRSILKLLDSPLEQSVILTPVGSKQYTIKEILEKLRSWLGYSKGKCLYISLNLIRIAAFFGNYLPASTINNTSYKMMMQNNVASDEDAKRFYEQVGFIPRDFSVGIHDQPSTVQDRWHAKLFFIKPAVQYSLVFIWLYSAIITAFFSPKEKTLALLSQAGITTSWLSISLYGSCLIDAAIALAIFFNYKYKIVGLIQIFVILTYTLIITWTIPLLWLDPLGAIAKNIPVLVLILVYLAIGSDR